PFWMAPGWRIRPNFLADWVVATERRPPMCCRNRLLSVLLLAALLLSACQPITPPERPQSPEPQGLRPDAPEYAKHGPYWVGYAPAVIGEGTARPIEAALWYPAQNLDGMQEE